MATQDSMSVGMYSFDCRDAAALAGFWAQVLRREVDEAHLRRSQPLVSTTTA